MSELDDTIVAVATAVGGGIGIIRLSGPDALPVARAHFRGWPTRVTPRRLYHGILTDGQGSDLDEGLAVFMPGPRSYTGEDIVELQLHGGALSLRRCLDALLASGLRAAEPGEFTRRAFLNGRMDLTRAEAVADLVSARTTRALAMAREHLSGRLERVALAARERIVGLRARVEVAIDFVDEDVPLQDGEALAAEAAEVSRELRALAATWRQGRLWREGARVALAGRPNAGKSSLFNAWCRRDRAIVTTEPGTTRDTLEETVELDGVPVVLVDTAGLRETEDRVEAAGIARAEAAMATADLVVYLVAPGDPWPAAAPAEGPPRLVVASKIDLGAAPDGVRGVSAETGEGLAALEAEVLARLGAAGGDGGELVIARERQRLALERAADALDAAAEGLRAEAPFELVAVDLQEAAHAVGTLMGEGTIEEVLDRLFAGFCIGK
ncbi:MAG: tRNA uridine-5-carboxymethylaminomethyl(34) synthesis GTPase MnmE [Deltaproteobacteria bacterium]|nr:tRNA uridine-5-carboxymethylaminomethyl(34) synthesis GTPase MnmE [Deltaproteobacteria bacterium]